MKCYKCSGVGKNESDNKSFCDSCFCEIVEKRVRKEIRINQLYQRNDKILIIDDDSYKSAINKYILKKIIQDPTIKFGIKKVRSFNETVDYDKEKKYSKIAIPWVLDNEITSYLKSRFEDKKIETLHSKKTIKPLVAITKEEAKTFANIRKLKYVKKDKKDDAEDMIDRFDKKYPGTKFGILKTIRALK